MKSVSTPSQYLDDKIACIVDSLIFGHLQRKQYSKTLNALLSESPHLTKDATTVSNDPSQIILNVNCFLHDQNLEQIIERFYTYGRFDVSPNLLELGKKLRSLTNEFSSELAFGCHSYSNNEQRLYGRKVRTRAQPTPAIMVDQLPFNSQLNVNKRALPAEYRIEQVPQSVSLPHNGQEDLQYSQDMESDGTRAEDLSAHESAHHSRRKAAQPLKQSQRVMQYVEKMSNENLRDKESGADNSSFYIDPLLEADNFNDIIKSVCDGTVDGLFETLVREEAYEADQNSRDSMNQSGGGAALALDIPMHDDPSSSSLISPLARYPSFSHQSFSTPTPHPSSSQPHNAPYSMNRSMPRHLIEQSSQQPSLTMDSGAYNEMSAHTSHIPAMPPPPPPPPLNPPMEPSKTDVVEPEKKQFRDMRENSWTKNGLSLSPPKTRLPPPPAPPPSSLPHPSSNALGTGSKLSSLGRIPKKGQSSGPSIIPPSPSDSPRSVHAASVFESSKGPEGFRMSRGKFPSLNGRHERRDSVESQDTLRAESVGESDCTLTENEDNDHPVRKESTKSERKDNWDALFEDSPSTVEESKRERERQKESLENRRRIEMKESEKKREREKRRKEKEKKEDDRKDGPKDDRNRQEKRPLDDRRRDSMGREEREKDDKLRKRREQDEQRKIIDAQKKQLENEERARQMKKEDEARKREVREKEEDKKREKERDMKKMEDEKKEIKSKEERRNELERKRRRESQLKKITEKPPMLLGASPLDKIAAEMDGKELKKENVIETTTRASSRVMEISSGIERNRPSSIVGSLHSSKSGIYLDKAQKLRDTTEKIPPEVRRPIRPNRVQMAPMKRPPSSMIEDEESEDDEPETPAQKRGKLEDNKINNILNKLHR